MRVRILAVCLSMAMLFTSSDSRSQAPAPAAPAAPAVVLRLAPLDDLIGTLQGLAKEIGLSEEAKQVEAMLKARTGPKGLEGVNTKKPIGLYAVLDKALDKSQVVFLMPVADEAAFLKFLDGIDFKVEKGKDGLHTMQVENVPFPVVFRVHDGYMHATLKVLPTTTLPEAAKLTSPETALAAGEGMMSLSVAGGNVPPALRSVAATYVALTLGEMKLQDAPEKQKALRDAILDETSRLLVAAINSSTNAKLVVDADRKTQDLSLTLNVTPKDGSALAKDVAAIASMKSTVAGLLGGDGVFVGNLHAATPDAVKKHLGDPIDKAIADHLAAMDAGTRDLLKPVLESLRPTLAEGVADYAAALRGPGKGGKFTLVQAMRAKKGADVEKAAKALVAKLPDDAKKPFSLDVASVGGTNVHQVAMNDVDAKTAAAFGKGPLTFAVRDDLVVFAIGEDALDAVKSALAAKPAPAMPVEATLSMAKFAKFIEADEKEAPAVAKRVFTAKDSDRVRLTLAAGKGLEAKLTARAAVPAFFILLDAEKKKEK